jgi:hypothetical protein
LLPDALSSIASRTSGFGHDNLELLLELLGLSLGEIWC